MKTLISMLMVGAVSLTFNFSAHSFSFDDVISAVKPEKKDPQIISLETQQTEIMSGLASSLFEVNKSQSLMADALGLSSEAALAQQGMSLLSNGFSGDQNSLGDLLTNTLTIQNALDGKMSTGGILDSLGQQQFTSALSSYGAGTSDLMAVLDKAMNLSSSVANITDMTSVAGLANMTNFSDLLFIINKAPQLIESFTSSTNSLVSFADLNNIDTTQLLSLASAWM